MDSAGHPGHEIEFETRDEFLEARFLGTFSVERFMRQQAEAAQACLNCGRNKLLVDLTQVKAVPSTTERYELASHATQVAWGLKVALIVDPSFLDRRKFGILVAQNRGLVVDAFTDRQQAIDWLLSPASGAKDLEPDAPST